MLIIYFTSLQPQQTVYEDEDDEDEGHDVLQAHRNRNRANRPPNPQQIHAFAQRQSTNWAAPARQNRNTRHIEHNADVDENMGTNDWDNIEADSDRGIGDAGEEEGPNECNSTGDSQQLNPHSLRSYPGDWRSILTYAKRNWQRFIILEQSDPFPEKDPSAKEIRKIIQRIVSERRADGEDVSRESFAILLHSFHFIQSILIV